MNMPAAEERYRCSRAGDRVDLVAAPRFADSVAAILAPYIAVDPSPSGLEAEYDSSRPWQVRAGSKPFAASAAHRAVDLTTEGEPDFRFWIDADRRELVLDRMVDRAFTVQCVARYIRILLRLMYASSGKTLFLHSGLVARDGRGVAFIGAKRSGKTSAIATLMRSGWTFVGNDDVTFTPDDRGQWIGHGWPRTVSVRADTLDALDLPAVAHTEDLYGRLSHPSRALPGSRDETRRWLIRPSEFAELLAAPPPASHVAVAAQVFPSFADRNAKPRLRRLDTEVAAGLLADHVQPVLTKSDRFLVDWFPGSSVARGFDLAVALGQGVPAYELHMGFDRLDECVPLIHDLIH